MKYIPSRRIRHRSNKTTALKPEQKYYRQQVMINTARQWNKTIPQSQYRFLRLTFGEYANRYLSTIPTDYMIQSLDLLDEYWLPLFVQELDYRQQNPKLGRFGIKAKEKSHAK